VRTGLVLKSSHRGADKLAGETAPIVCPVFSVNYSFASCCLIQKCYPRVLPIFSLKLTSAGVKISRIAGSFCWILYPVGEAEAGSGGDQPAKE
jgi:hypothetical protein